MENKRNYHGHKSGRKPSRKFGHKPGRPPQKPDYDPEKLMRELLDAVVEVYREKNEIKATALELDLPPNKIKKLLITAEVISYPETEQIQQLLNAGKSVTEVGEELHLSRAPSIPIFPTVSVSIRRRRSARMQRGWRSIESGRRLSSPSAV